MGYVRRITYKEKERRILIDWRNTTLFNRTMMITNTMIMIGVWTSLVIGIIG